MEQFYYQLHNMNEFIREKALRPFKIVLLVEQKIDEYFSINNKKELSLVMDTEKVISRISK